MRNYSLTPHVRRGLESPMFEYGSKRFFKELIEGFIVVFILRNIIGEFFHLLAIIINIVQKSKYWNTLYMLGFLGYVNLS